MSAAKNNVHKQRPGGNRSMAQIGLMDIPPIPQLGAMSDDECDDDDLEAELNALIGGGGNVNRAKSPAKRRPLAMGELKNMTDACMDENVSDLDEDDENDPELLDELKGFLEAESDNDEHLVVKAPPEPPANSLKALEERLADYIAAEREAIQGNESSKARRYKRAIKNLNELIKMAKAGKTVNPDDVPPRPPKLTHQAKPPPQQQQTNQTINDGVHIKQASSPPPPMSTSNEAVATRQVSEAPKPLPVVSQTDDIKAKHALLTERRNQYRQAALAAKRANDKETAIKYITIIKQFDSVIAALDSGQVVDLSGMPPPPSTESKPVTAPVNHDESESDEDENAGAPKLAPPATPAAIIESLQQRCQKYKEISAAAKEEGNNSKARRTQRIVKQYEEALRNYKAGRNVVWDELPSIPGLPPLPREEPRLATSDVKESNPASPQTSPANPEASIAKKQPAPQPPPRSETMQSKVPPKAAGRAPMKRAMSTSMTQQMAFLTERQKLFKQAALESKRNGHTESALEYLRMAKGITPLIDAVMGGLPVSLNTVPIPPQLKEDFEVVNVSDCNEHQRDPDDLYQNLQDDLKKQLQICLTTSKMFMKQGDVASASKFENLAIETKKDYLVIQNSMKRKDPVPKFHYENRSYSIVRNNADLKDNEIELTIMKGINLPSSDEGLNSYIRYEFAYPSDTPQTGKTSTFKNTRNPEYNTKIMLEMNRKSRGTVRIFKRNAFKVEAWARGGLFSSDSLLGTLKVPISILESKTQIHDTYDLMNGRRSTGGKLELKVRLKEPLSCKEVEKVKERWLVIGS